MPYITHDFPIEFVNVQLRVPFTVILKAMDQLEANELCLLAQRLEDRLAAV